MKKVWAIMVLGFLASAAQAGDARPAPEEIIKRFAEKESEFRKVWQQYTYTQHIQFQVLDPMGNVREQKEMTVEVYFTTGGERKTRILNDRGQLRSVGVTEEDIQDAGSRQPFVLTTDDLPNYEIEYKGHKQVDELFTYVFDIEPRRVEGRKRYFKGRIWVDDVDFQIVKTLGKIVPDYADNKFPEFETIREQIDGEYWFPTWTKADDVLQFGDFFRGRSVRVREIITYENFKKFEVDTTIKYGTAQ